MTDPVVNGPDTTTGNPVAKRTGSSSGRTTESSGGSRNGLSDASSAAADAGARDADEAAREPGADNRPRRRRGSRGGRNRNRSAADRAADETAGESDASDDGGAEVVEIASDGGALNEDAADKAKNRGGRGRRPGANRTPAGGELPDELPDKPTKGKPRSAEAAARALVRKPKIGDSRPAPVTDDDAAAAPDTSDSARSRTGNRRRRGRGGRAEGAAEQPATRTGGSQTTGGRRTRGGVKVTRPVEATLPDEPLDLDEDDLKRRRGRERKGRPVGRYLMCVSKGPKATQIAVLEGRNLIEHYVSHPSDDISQIHGNIYLGRVQNVLPGMEAAFIDIGTPKNAVLYRGDVQYDAEDVEEKGTPARIEQILKPKQTILCQVTKNPIAHKGARLTQEVSLPGRFVVLIPNSSTYGISKRLSDDERKRLRNILDRVRPKGHGLIVRTAADGVTAEEIERDVLSLTERWHQIDALAKKAGSPALLYREPEMAVRVIREELNQNYRGIVIDDQGLYEEVRSYVNAISPALVERVQFYDPEVEPLSVFERHHVHEQLHRALDKKVWLPSGGSLIVEHTEALTVIDVNTGKNVGSSSLEETVFKNNLEAAEEIAKQLRLRDIGGIIVIDFIDMEIEGNRKIVIKAFRDALARDKTRTQVFDISDLGLVEMTRKRIGEGLLEGFASRCPECEGRGLIIDEDMLK
jgi:ribonuclease E